MRNSTIGRKRREEEVTWKAPEEGWYKMNVDGTYNNLNNGELVGCGGLLRNHEGTFLEGFLMNASGSGNNSHLNIAHLWGCLLGLKNAWDLGIRTLIVETDSTAVQAAIQPREAGGQVAESSQPAPERDLIVREIQQVLARSWEVRVLLVDRDCNVAARRLAKAALSCMPGFHRLHHLPEDVLEVVLREAALRVKKTK